MSDQAQYYRITYRGVVALLTEEGTSKKSGAYLGYGEVIKSCEVKNLEIHGSANSTYTDYSASHRSASTSSVQLPLSNGGQHSSYNGGIKFVRVDKVLTGGYAVDTHVHGNSARQPLHLQQDATAADEDECTSSSSYGYLYTRRNNFSIAERVDVPQICEAGSFAYRICSSSPVCVLAGPAADAPTTKAMLLPNSVHNVCLKVQHSGSEAIFLRLSHCRGWICDRLLGVQKVSGGVRRHILVAQECTGQMIAGAAGTSVSLSSSIPMSKKSPVRNGSRLHRHAMETPRKLRLQGHGLIRDVATVSHDTGQDHRNSSDTTIESAASPTISQLSDDSITTTPRHVPSEVMSELVSNNAAAVKVTTATASTVNIPNFFLMRVVAPLGLKILDAPQFQVNNLIHGQSHPSTPNMRAAIDSMEPKKSRILPYGTLFEASKRITNSGVYSPGAGLVKLSDNSGWAIIPRQDELEEQFGNLDGVNRSALSAVQEVGNAIIDPPESSRVWLRILPSNGILVSCPPPPVGTDNETHRDASPTSSAGGSSISNRFLRKADSDGGSSVGGNSLIEGAFRTPKKDHRELLNKVSRPIIIPCGTCVGVEAFITDDKIKLEASLPNLLAQNFARIRGGQGWIPRHLDGEDFSIEVEKPEIRVGSFWFRVQSKRGIIVRQGPSRKALPITSDRGDEFRFECGEFLRASEVLTVFYSESGSKYSESFAKLYRKSNITRSQVASKARGSIVEQPPTLIDLTRPGEWVAVHSYGRLYLEECSVPPSIERHRAGWRYNAVLESGIQVRHGPSFLAAKSNKLLRAGESVLITERVTAHGDQVTWLRLKDGHGWVHDIEEDGRIVMIAHSLKWRNRADSQNRVKEGEYKGLMSRIFSNDNASSVISL